MSTSPDKCLRCEQEVDSYWFTFGLPGAYCKECVDFVVDEHEFLSRLSDKIVDTLKQNLNDLIKQHNERYEKAKANEKKP